MMLNQSYSYILNNPILMQKPKNLLFSSYNFNPSNKTKKISLSRPSTKSAKLEAFEKILIQNNFDKKENENSDILFPSSTEKLNISYFKPSFKKINTAISKEDILRLMEDLSDKTRKTKSIIKMQNTNEFSRNNNLNKNHFFYNTNHKDSIKWKILQGSTNTEQNKNLFLPEICNEQNTPIKINSEASNSSRKNIIDISFGESEESLMKISKTTTSIETKKDTNTINSSTDKFKSKSKNKKDIDLFRSKKIKTINKNLVILNKLQNGNLINLEPVKKRQESPSILELKFPDYPSVKCSTKRVSEYIECYAVNTYKGLVKTTNENKIAIILSVGNSQNIKCHWPKTSFLAIYDGKFGTKCSKFLRDKLHTYIITDNNFPRNPREAILNGFKKVEIEFLNMVKNTEDEKSGSCVILCLILDNEVYIANCGDSKAFLSINHLQKIKILNKCHSLLNNPSEKERLMNSGLKIVSSKNGKEKIVPGNLKITRGIGFANLKFIEGENIENGILGIPQIKQIEIDENCDFLVILSGGVLSNCHSKEIIDAIYKVIKKQKRLHLNSVSELAGACVDMVLKTSLVKGTLENVSCIFIGFKNFNTLFRSSNSSRENSSKEINFNDKKKVRLLLSNRNNDSKHKKIIKSVNPYEENIAKTARNIRPQKKMRLNSKEETASLRRKINFEVNCNSSNSNNISEDAE